MNNNERLPMMKRLLLIWAMVFGLGMQGWGLELVNYAEFEELWRRGDVTMVVKDNDYRMLVGKLKKPGAVFMRGYSREQAQQRFVKLMKELEREYQPGQSRSIVFCGRLLHYSSSGTGEKTVYTFQIDGEKDRFSLSKKGLDELAEPLD